MSRISLGSVIDSHFITRFQGMAKSQGGGSAIANALHGRSSSVTIQDGLRLGAKTYVTAIQALNSIISFVNVSSVALNKLGDITDKLLSLVKRATQGDVSEQERAHLQREYTSLGKDFQKIVANDKIGDREYLTLDGLEGVFGVMGLDPTQAKDAAELFKEFVTGPNDLLLASKTIKGKRPVDIPPSAYRSASSGASTYSMVQLSANDPGGAPTTTGQTGLITKENSIIEVHQTGPDGDAVDIKSRATGGVRNISSGTYAYTLKTANEQTGDSIIESDEDFLGFNSAHTKNLFLVNSAGEVVHQYTDNSADAYTYGEVSVAGDNLTVLYSRTDSGATTALVKSESAAIGEDPTLASAVAVETYGAGADLNIFNGAAISDDGTYLAYRSNAAGSWQTKLMDSATLTADGTLLADTTVKSLGFVGSNKLAVARDTDVDGTSDTVSLFTAGSGSFTNVLTGVNIDKFATLQKGSGVSGYFTYSSAAAGDAKDVYLKKEDGTAVTKYDANGAGDSISRLSLAYNSGGRAEVGVFGVLSGVQADSDNELYRLITRRDRSLTRVSREGVDVFDGTLNLMNRPDAFRLLTDIKAIKSQLDKNIKAVGDAMDFLQSNIDIVRAAGLAMLRVADQITTTEKAEQVAQKLRAEILKSTPAALAQAQNLSNIAVAALLLDNPDMATKSG